MKKIKKRLEARDLPVRLTSEQLNARARELVETAQVAR